MAARRVRARRDRHRPIRVGSRRRRLPSEPYRAGVVVSHPSSRQPASADPLRKESSVTILTDGQIHALAVAHPDLIEPFHASQLKPCSYDVRLHGDFIRPVVTGAVPVMDAETGETMGIEYRRYTNRDTFDLAPHDFVLASTEERVHIPDDMVATLEGKSTLGRMGLTVHVTAGFIDPGFEGRITLELKNEAPYSLKLRRHQLIGQLVWQRLDEPAIHPYGSRQADSHYQGQDSVRGPAVLLHRRE